MFFLIPFFTIFVVNTASLAQYVSPQIIPEKILDKESAVQNETTLNSAWATASTWRIYMAPRNGWYYGGVEVSGQDSNPGTPQYPVRTLNGAQRIVGELLGSGLPLRDIEVRIASRLYDYPNQHVTWTKNMPRNTITFLPWIGNERPVFDGRASATTCTNSSTICGDVCGVSFFKLKVTGQANIIMRYMKIQYYGSGVAVQGAQGSQFYGMYFYKIGSAHQNIRGTTAAVSIYGGAKYTRFENSHFINIENRPSPDVCYGPGEIHAIYLEDKGTEGSIIERNLFEYVSGDPVRIRNGVHNTFTNYNIFRRTGLNAFGSHYMNGTSDCPSFLSRFRFNILDGLYSCQAPHPSTVQGFRTNIFQTVPSNCTIPTWNGSGLPPQLFSAHGTVFVNESCP